MRYAEHSIKNLSQLLIEATVRQIRLYDDETVVWVNYSDRINPDDPDFGHRDFILHEIYIVTVTVKYIVVKKKI